MNFSLKNLSFTSNTDIFSDLKFIDSKDNVLIQVADMVAGCVAAYHKNEDRALYNLLSKRIEDIWVFK